MFFYKSHSSDKKSQVILQNESVSKLIQLGNFEMNQVVSCSKWGIR